jgi:Mrp family chromosome partitioning ATPase
MGKNKHQTRGFHVYRTSGRPIGPPAVLRGYRDEILAHCARLLSSLPEIGHNGSKEAFKNNNGNCAVNMPSPPAPLPKGEGSNICTTAKTYPRAIGLISCSRGEGVSTVAAHLALAAAIHGKSPALLVDANCESPNLHDLFDVDREPGLIEVLHDRVQLAEVCQSVNGNQLSVLAAGRLARSEVPMQDTADMTDFLEAVKSRYSMVIFDLGAIDPASITWPLVNKLDGLLLVVEAEKVDWEAARRCKQSLTAAGANLLGAVFNKHRRVLPAWLDRLL